MSTEGDPTNPSYYAACSTEYGFEPADIAERLPFAVGTAFCYLWRWGKKGSPRDGLLDLKKALWWLSRPTASVHGATRTLGVPEAVLRRAVDHHVDVRVRDILLGMLHRSLQVYHNAEACHGHVIFEATCNRLRNLIAHIEES